MQQNTNKFIFTKYASKFCCDRLFLIISLAYFVTPLSAKTSKLDSLKAILVSMRDDTNKVNVLLDISGNATCDDTIKLNSSLTALSLSTKLQWISGIIHSNGQLGDFYSICHFNANNAISYYQQQISAAEKVNDRETKATAMSGIGMIYLKTAQYKKAIEYYQQGYDFEDIPSNKIAVLGNIGQCYLNLSDYTNALTYYQRSLHIFDSSIKYSHNNTSEDTAVLGLLLITVGDIYKYSAQYDKAFANYDQALKLNEKIKNPVLELFVYQSIASVYDLKNDIPNATAYYEKALKICVNTQQSNYQAANLDKLSNIYIKQGNAEKAMSYAQQCLAIMQPDIDAGQIDKWYSQLAPSYLTLGRIYALEKAYPKAISFFQRSLDISKNIGLIDNESEAWQELSKTYTQTGQTAKAFDAYKQYISLRDSLYSQEKAKQITSLELNADFSKKQTDDSLTQLAARNELHLRLQQQKFYTFGGFAAVLGTLVLAFFIFRNYRLQRKANVIINSEKQKSEELLLNILPGEVASELKAHGKVRAQSFENVTVIFTDFVNFTKTAEDMSAQQLVDELDECFQAFDTIIDKYNIEKIKTIGDAYMAVSGLPVTNPAHAMNMVLAAIEIRDYLNQRRAARGGIGFQSRIGIHSGNVIAGIVGWKKFAYDIWGDTVNIAARMEQNSQPGKINISESTYQLVKELFACEYRGEVDAKHKGLLKMYFVEKLPVTEEVAQ